jgi:glutathione S-transferase
MGLQETPNDPAAVAARAGAARFYDEMERVLGEHQYLAGPYCYADIAFYMAQLFGARMGAPMTDAAPRLRRWRDRVTLRPAVREVVGSMIAFLVSHRRPIPDFLSGVGSR